jgi:hypothetical protein
MRRSEKIVLFPKSGYVSPEGHLATSEETLASLGHGYYIYGLPGESMPPDR